jgi:ligand-binding SRPBCC domain-containing protein
VNQWLGRLFDMAQIELTINIAAPVERCFDLARIVELHTRSTSSTGERVIAGRTSGLLELDEEVTWQARHCSVWQTLTSRVTAFDQPTYFRDSMVSGAFKRFDHHHHFTSDGTGGTVMRDVFDYSAPLGVVGWLAEQLFLTRYMRRFLEARNREIKAVAESNLWSHFLPERPNTPLRPTAEKRGG